MTRPGVQVRLAVIVRTLVLILNEHANRRTQGDVVLNSGLDVNGIFFVSGGGEVRLTRATTGELGLDISCR